MRTFNKVPTPYKKSKVSLIAIDHFFFLNFPITKRISIYIFVFFVLFHHAKIVDFLFEENLSLINSTIYGQMSICGCTSRKQLNSRYM